MANEKIQETLFVKGTTFSGITKEGKPYEFTKYVLTDGKLQLPLSCGRSEIEIRGFLSIIMELGLQIVYEKVER